MKQDHYYYTEPKPHHKKRICWYIVNHTLFRWLSIGKPMRYARNLLLRLFGAKLPIKALIYPTCEIWAPWNLVIGKYCCIGPHTQLYNKAPIILGDNTIVSQGAYLCTASHDITNPHHALITAPIKIESWAWVAADAFVGMGVTIGEGAVVGARACVFKDVQPWTVVGGNPAKVIKKRVIKEEVNS